MLFLFIEIFIIPIFVLTVIITFIVKAVKSKNNIENNVAEQIKDLNKSNLEQEGLPSNNITCKYCGSANPKTERNCSSCGANLHTKK